MSECSISIPVLGSVVDLISKANQAITLNGGSFSGDSVAGNFEISVIIGKIKGNYTVNGSSFDIIITDKPFMVSCSRIEGELRKYLDSEPLNKPIA